LLAAAVEVVVVQEGFTHAVQNKVAPKFGVAAVEVVALAQMVAVLAQEVRQI
jgi:hypothetical protein